MTPFSGINHNNSSNRLRKTKRYLAALALAATSIQWSPLMAHEGGHGPADPNVTPHKSTWTIAKTKKHFHGTYLTTEDGNAKFETENGKTLEIPILDLIDADRDWVRARRDAIKELNERPKIKFINLATHTEEEIVVNDDSPSIMEHFKPFEKTLGLRWDNDFFYVESNGIPDHPMMVGITAWQQQVPLPQSYTGRNAWRIPLHPKPASKPMSAKTNFFRGAIALAVNGVPIFNPIKNDGRTDTLLAGELDEYGGHCGRADDYHYHIAPVHLEPLVGKGNPVGYALDGYPIFGYVDPDSKDNAPLDWLNGHKDKDGHYHYHATKNYPYLNGGFYGEVVERDGQVDPQPRAESPRPALPPLRGAKIVGFEETSPKQFQLTYEISGRKGFVRYKLGENGAVSFEFQDPNGKVNKENYDKPPQRRGPPRDNARDGRRDDRPPPPPPTQNRPRGNENPPRNNPPPRPDENKSAAKPAEPRRNPNAAALQVTSASVDSRGRLLKDCTCDGAGQSPAVAWGKVPDGTKSIAVSLWHQAPDQEKSYWLVYNVPATVTEIPQNKVAEGILGLNDKKKNGYDPMCSKGPGVKTYNITVFALSKQIELSGKEVDRHKLLEQIKDCTLAEGTLEYQYERDK